MTDPMILDLRGRQTLSTAASRAFQAEDLEAASAVAPFAAAAAALGIDLWDDQTSPFSLEEGFWSETLEDDLAWFQLGSNTASFASELSRVGLALHCAGKAVKVLGKADVRAVRIQLPGVTHVEDPILVLRSVDENFPIRDLRHAAEASVRVAVEPRMINPATAPAMRESLERVEYGTSGAEQGLGFSPIEPVDRHGAASIELDDRYWVDNTRVTFEAFVVVPEWSIVAMPWIVMATAAAARTAGLNGTLLIDVERTTPAN